MSFFFLVSRYCSIPEYLYEIHAGATVRARTRDVNELMNGNEKMVTRVRRKMMRWKKWFGSQLHLRTLA